MNQNNHHFLDNFHLLLDEYNEAGYHTLWSEEEATFDSYGTKGFKRKPAEYYGRGFQVLKIPNPILLVKEISLEGLWYQSNEKSLLKLYNRKIQIILYIVSISVTFKFQKMSFSANIFPAF